MADEEHGAALAAADVLHLADGLLLELGIAYGEHFVDDEDLGLHESSNGEAEADGHARGVALHGGVDVAGHAGEVDDVVELAADFVARHAHDGAVHEDVLAACHLGMETGTYLEQRADAATGADGAGGGRGDL